MRTKISDDIKTAMKAGDKSRVGTLRLVNAAIQSAEIEAKMALDDAGIIAVMTKMVKQRRDSVEQYTKGGRDDLAAAETAEIAIIEGYLPKQMSDSEVATAVADAVKESGAITQKDMGRVMALLKSKHAGKMDFQKASGAVKAALG